MAKQQNEEQRVKQVAKETSIVVEDALRSIASNIGQVFQDALSEGQDISKAMVSDIQGGLNSLAKVSKTLAEAQSKAVQGALTQRDITREMEQRNAKIFAIKAQIAIAGNNELEVTKKLKEQLAEIEDSNVEIEKALKAQLDYSQKIEKNMGLFGSALKGAERLTSKLGLSGINTVFEKAKDAAQAKAKALADSGKKAGGVVNKVKVLAAGLGALGKGIKEAFSFETIALGAVGLMKKLFSFIKEGYEEGKKAAARISGENVEIARSLGLAQGPANKLAASVAGMGPTTAATKQSITAIYGALGSTEKLSKSTLKTFVQLNTFAGFSAEALAKFQKFAKLSGQDAGVMVKQMADTALEQIKTNKLAISEKQLLEEVSDVSGTIKLRFAQQPKELVKAVAASKKLGLNMEQIKNAAESLLNIEDSIAAEMEAELMTGKDLNLEKARELALAGKSEEAVKLIADQMGGAAEYSKLNVLEQESLAKVLGMNRDEFANMAMAQKENISANGDLVDGQKDGLKAMQSQTSLQETLEERERRREEASIGMFNALGPAMAKLEDTFIKIKRIFTNFIADNIVKPLADFVTSPKGQKFLDALPGMLQKGLEKIKSMVPYIMKGVGLVMEFIKANPWLSAAAGIGGPLLLKGISSLAAGASALRGATKYTPMYVKNVDGGAGAAGAAEDLIGQAGKAGFFKQLKTLFTKPGVMFRALAMKGGMFGKVLGKTGMLLGKFGSGLGKVVGSLGKFGNSLLKMGGSLLSKVGGSLGKFFKGAGETLFGKSYKGGQFMKGGGRAAAGGQRSGGLFSKLWSGAKNVAGKAWSGATNVAGKAFSGVKSVAKSVGGAISKLNPLSALKSGLIGKAGKFIGKAIKGGGLLSALFGAADIAGILMSKSSPIDKAKMILPSAAGTIGSILGTVAGSVLGPLGSIGGGLLGQYIGSWIGSSKPIQNALAPPLAKALGGDDVADDFVMQNGKVQRFRKDDIVMGGTSLNKGGDEKVIRLLERLVSAAEKGGHVYIDGNKVGTALALKNYRSR
jgi:hypothetical protein